MEPVKVWVEVVHVAAAPRVYSVLIDDGASVFEAIRLSMVLEERPGIDLRVQRVGVFGRVVALSEPVKAGDRVEIYEPLAFDPKDARRKRARAARAKPTSRKCGGG